MLGAGLQFGRSRGEDRFYNPAKARSARRNQLNRDQIRRSPIDVTENQSPAVKEKALSSPVYREPENKSELEEPPKHVVLPAVEPVASPLCNLERFLESITLAVPVQYLSKVILNLKILFLV